VLGPHHLSRPGPRRRDRGQGGVVESVEQPPARRVRRHRPEQRLLIGQDGDLRDRPRPARIVLAPPATATARSTCTRPGSCRTRGLRNPAKASASSAVNVVRSATSASSRDPTCETTPAPSAVTTIFGRVVVARTWKVPPLTGEQNLQQALSYLVTRHFLLSGPPAIHHAHEEPG
jgi:hypothetical protein